MVKGWKAGLLVLSALATTTPALAQHGNWGGRGGGAERHGNSNGGGGEGRGGWRGNGGDNRPAPSAPTPAAPSPAPNRAWSAPDGGTRNWQARQGENRSWSTPSTNPAQTNRDWNRNEAFRDRDDSRWNNGRGGDRPQSSYARPDNDGRRDNRDWQRDGRQDRGWQDRGWQNGGRLSNADRWRDQQRWSNNWRRDDRYDWSRYRQYNRDAYRMPAYRPPYGWNSGYSRFSIGIFLGSPLFASSYWLDDPYSYRLPPAYGTLRWIRYYDDALLVDIRDGYVVDVIHDFFW